MRPSPSHPILCALFAFPAWVFGLMLSTTTHTCYKNLPKTCPTGAKVQNDCDIAILDVCTLAKTAYAGTILYNTTESCTATMNLGDTGFFDYGTCVSAFQAITIDCMLSDGANFAANSQGGIQNMVPMVDNWEQWDQADTNKPAWLIAASGCL